MSCRLLRQRGSVPQTNAGSAPPRGIKHVPHNTGGARAKPGNEQASG